MYNKLIRTDGEDYRYTWTTTQFYSCFEGTLEMDVIQLAPIRKQALLWLWELLTMTKYFIAQVQLRKILDARE